MKTVYVIVSSFAGVLDEVLAFSNGLDRDNELLRLKREAVIEYVSYDGADKDWSAATDIQVTGGYADILKNDESGIQEYVAFDCEVRGGPFANMDAVASWDNYLATSENL